MAVSNKGGSSKAATQQRERWRLQARVLGRLSVFCLESTWQKTVKKRTERMKAHGREVQLQGETDGLAAFEKDVRRAITEPELAAVQNPRPSDKDPIYLFYTCSSFGAALEPVTRVIVAHKGKGNGRFITAYGRPVMHEPDAWREVLVDRREVPEPCVAPSKGPSIIRSRPSAGPRPRRSTHAMGELIDPEMRERLGQAVRRGAGGTGRPRGSA